MKIFSKDIINNERIDNRFTCEGNDISPEIYWESVPDNTKSLALIVDDPDAPGKTWVHWVVYNIPPEIRGFERGISKAKLDSKGIVQGLTDFGIRKYGGPCPPQGHGVHNYYFKLYALDIELDIGGDANKEEVEQAMEGHVLSSDKIVGRFDRN